MKKLFAVLAVFALAFFAAGCSQSGDKTLWDRIKVSPAARLELPDGTSVSVDGEIDSIRSFADLDLMAAPLEPADEETDWLYRIVFDPSEMVKDAKEIVVSFHEKYLQIDSEYYLPAKGVAYESVLEWAESKFDYFMG